MVRRQTRSEVGGRGVDSVTHGVTRADRKLQNHTPHTQESEQELQWRRGGSEMAMAARDSRLWGLGPGICAFRD